VSANILTNHNHLIISQYNILISSEKNTEYAYYTIIYTKLQLFYLAYYKQFVAKKQSLFCLATFLLEALVCDMDDLNLPVDIQLELFDTMVLPVVMYGCDVWSFEKNNILESFCLQFYKILLGLKKNTPNCILYGELCRYPIDIFIKCRMIAFWQRIVCNRQDKIDNNR
jgi:hypothetical protein